MYMSRSKKSFQNKLEIIDLIRCPDCFSETLATNSEADNMRCTNCEVKFPFLYGRPVLLGHDNTLFPLEAYKESSINEIASSARLSTWFNRLIPSPSINLSCNRILDSLKSDLSRLDASLVLVVGGGNQRVWLTDKLEASNRLKIIFTDIDTQSDVDLFCDGHNLPFKDNCFDAVITTAVLEHVLYPEKVAAEIHRVLKIGGLIYSELPFMQQVHEGAYDFNRYTLSGHRRLFNRFEELESGMVAGPATALVWAIENFVLAFVSYPVMRKLLKAMSRFFFSWIKYLDYLLKNRSGAMDGASCTYFYGSKIDGRRADNNIIASYVGNKYMRHI